jgi:hypothetical protein
VKSLEIGPVVTNHGEKIVVTITPGAVIANLPEVYVNELNGDDERGDGTRDKPFRTRERAAKALGVPVAQLMPLPYGNRHERRAARAR